MPKHYALRALLVCIGLYHIGCGILANASSESLLWVANKLAGVSITPDAQLLFIARPFGIYVIAFGVMALLAAINPVKNRAFISVAAGLFIVRAAQRLIYAQQFETTFNVPHSRNLITIAIVTAFALALLLLRLQLRREMQQVPAEESKAA